MQYLKIADNNILWNYLLDNLVIIGIIGIF